MSDVAARLAAALQDRYRIERELGQGGMATVYLAEDLKHNRKVAIKVLKPALAAVLGADRFVQEIQTTAQLQHPHILPLFDSGSADGFLYYVMPFIEGETLRDKLNRETQLGIDEAVRITTEVADALDYAHRHGVVHRDIKPENILLHDGRPMVADFGIALALSAAAGGRMTETGMSLGTPHYMSPEQATADKDITGRSDIYSLASVLYEMLTGNPPHMGSSAQQIIMKIIAEDVKPVTEFRKSVPANVAAAVSKALEKLPADRFESAKAFAEALANPGFRMAGAAAPGVAPGYATERRARYRDPAVLALAALSALLLFAAAWGWLRPGSTPSASPELAPIQYLLSTDSARPAWLAAWPAAISPDGGTVVFAATAPDGQQLLYAQRTNELEAHPLPGTAGAVQPYFSPDGRWVAFEQAGAERKQRLDGGAPVTIVGGGMQANGATWTSGDEVVVGSHLPVRGLSKVSAGGGTLVEFTRVDSVQGQLSHLWPLATPDPRAVAFVLWYGSLESAKLALASLDDGHITPLNLNGIRPLAVLDGHLVYLQADGTVMAVPLDLRHRRVTGPPVPVLDRIAVQQGNNGNSDIYVSSAGAMITGRRSSLRRLVWVSPDGRSRSVLPDTREYDGVALSPDGGHIAAVVSDDHGSDVWMYDTRLSTFSRLTALGTAVTAEWSADGSRVVLVAQDSASRNAVWSESAAGGSTPRELFADPRLIGHVSLSPDGTSLLVQLFRVSWDLVSLPLDAADSTHVARPYVDTQFEERYPRFSPDGKWVAYTSDETGQLEVYVRSFPDPSTKVHVSVGGGTVPVWAPDGSRLYYVTGSRPASLLSARVALTPTFRLLGRDTVTSIDAIDPTLGYGVSRDGKSVLGVASGSGGLQLVVSPNWITELRRRLAAAEASGGGSR